LTPVWYQVRDLQAGRAFYTGKLGFDETYVDADGSWVKLERNGMEIGLAEGEPQEDGGVAHVDVRQDVALQQSAHADEHVVRAARGAPQSETVHVVHRHRPFAQVAIGVVDVAHAAIADVLEERRLVQQLDDARRIVEHEAPQREALGLELRKDRQSAIARRWAGRPRTSPSRCHR